MSTEQAIDIPQGYKMTELGLLPEEWQVVRLGEVAEAKGGNSFPLKYQGDTKGKYPFFKVADMNNLGNEIYMVKYNHSIGEEVLFKLKAKAFPKDTIIFPKVGGAVHTNKKRILTKDSLVDNNIMCVIPLTKFLYPFYAFCFFQNFDLKSICNPGPLPSINSSSVRDLLLPLPPFPEQRAIAHILQTVQVAKEKIEGVIQAAKELKKSFLKYLFSYGPVPVEDAEKVPLKKAEVGLIPEEWQVVRLGEVVYRGKYRNPRRDPNSEFQYVDVSSVSNEKLKITNTISYNGKKAPSRARKIIHRGDTIFATVRPYLKRVSQVPSYLDGQVCSTAFTVLRANEKYITKSFLFFSVIKDRFVCRVSTHQKGSSYPAITDKDVLNENIPLPSLHIQQRIADILSTVDERIESAENQKQSLDILFKTLLSLLMSGKIRVNRSHGLVNEVEYEKG
jgi:type I restriction enzyme S subunit